MKTYKANKKGFIRYLLAGFLLLPILIFYLDQNTFIEKPFILLPLLSPLALITWVYFDTYYKIEQNNLIYRSAFLRGKIAISDIKEIQKGDRKSTRLNSSHVSISYAVFCLTEKRLVARLLAATAMFVT